MGGLPWDVAARDLPVPEAISQRRAALGIPQATPTAQEAPPQAAKRGQGQACGDGQTAPDTQDQSTKRSKSVYNIISTQGWVGPSYALILPSGGFLLRFSRTFDEVGRFPAWNDREFPGKRRPVCRVAAPHHRKCGRTPLTRSFPARGPSRSWRHG